MKKILVSVTLFLLTVINGQADTPSTHGMLLFGNKSNFVSHLPMFHAPHDYQLIMEIELVANANSAVLAKYEAAKAASKTLFTIEPEVMDLSKVINGIKTEFKATLYDGHFERGGESLGDVKVKIKKILLSKKLNANEEATGSEDYYVFGKNGEYFGAHLIGGKPNFDSILKVAPLTQTTHFGNCGRAGCPDPTLKPISDDQLPMILSSNDENTDSALPANSSLSDFLITTKVIESIYFEKEELSH